MRATVTAVILAALLASAACGRTETPRERYRDQLPLPAEPLVKQVPSVGQYGGRFVIAQTSAPKTFNGMMANETSSTDVTNMMFVGMTDFDKTTQMTVPALAKAWHVTPDRLTWTFELRRGAAFSDGHPITADDVLFSFSVAYDPGVHPSVQDLLIMDGKTFDVSAPDSHTIVVKTPAPNAMLPSLAGSVPVLPKHVLEAAFRNGAFASAYNVSTPPDQIVTSGPWKVGRYLANERTTLVRNPYWFGIDQNKQRLPYLDEVVFRLVPDQDAADLALRAGEIDGLENVKPENYSWYEENQKSGGFVVHDLGPRLSTNFMWFNLNTLDKPASGRRAGDPEVGALKYSWFNNPTFRRAVSMAIDRDAMIRSIFSGYAEKNWSQQTSGSKQWYSADTPHADYNPAEARRLLASLGWKDANRDGVLEDRQGNAITFTIKTNSDNLLRVSMANFIRDDLTKVGLRAVLTPVDFNTLITNIREDFQYDAILLGLQSGVPPDPGMGQNVWRSSGRTHFWNMAQPAPATPQEARVNELMDVIVSVPEHDKRKAAWHEIEVLVNEQAWFIWLPTNVLKVPVRARFTNLRPTVIPHVLLRDIETVYVTPENGES